MEAKELRLGNWVQIDMGTKCGKDFIYEQIKKIEGEQIDALPIPLTPEILERCGFVDHHLGWMQKVKNGIVKCKLNAIGCEIKVGEIIFSHIQYLHQLQNLYFALTGEELTFDNFLITSLVKYY